MPRFDVEVKMTMLYVRAIEAPTAMDAQQEMLGDGELGDPVKVDTEIRVEQGVR